MDKNVSSVAIILAAGTGKRMNSNTPKQYLTLDNKPVLYYSLKAFEESSINEIILVVGRNEIDYCRREIVEKYNIKKVTAIIEGGLERYDSVYQGLLNVKDADYILIHDGARPFITVEIIERTMEQVVIHKACVVGVPSKDTVKIVDTDGKVIKTPKRENVWCTQTPQAFSFQLIYEAYKKVMEGNYPYITDDAMVVEQTTRYPIRMIHGSYSNIKITTPEDLLMGELMLTRSCT